jgi:hypothetical protein
MTHGVHLWRCSVNAMAAHGVGRQHQIVLGCSLYNCYRLREVHCSSTLSSADPDEVHADLSQHVTRNG